MLAIILTVFIILFSAILILFQIFLIVTTNLNIYPEFFFYPWMMSKGYLIYRDFGVQHGFLSYLLLLPFSLDKSLLTLKIFYVAVQSLNMILILLILRKTSSKMGIILGGLLYLVLNFYLSENNLWDEIYVSPFFLLTYYLAINENIKTKTKLLATGFLIGLTTLMKPNFGIMIIPVILYFRSLIPFIPIVFLWLLTLFYFFLNQALPHFLDNYIFFNRYFLTLSKNFWLEQDFFRFTIFVFIVSLLINWLKSEDTSLEHFKEPMSLEGSSSMQKRRYRAFLRITILFSLASLVLFYPGYNKIYLLPFAGFLVIFISQLLSKTGGSLQERGDMLFEQMTEGDPHQRVSVCEKRRIKLSKIKRLAESTLRNYLRFFYLILIFLFLIFVSRKAKHQYVYLDTYRIIYMENKSIQKTVNELKKINLSNKRLYVLGNQIELYYLLDKPSQVRFYMIFDFGKNYFTDIENQIIKDLEKNKVDLVLEPKPLDKNYLSLTKLRSYISTNFRLIKDSKTFRLYNK